MIRSTRKLALATGAAALLLLTGCGEAEVRPGAAALVGEERIGTEELQQLVDRGLTDPQAAQQLGGDREGYQRQALSRLINRALLEQAAEREGVSVAEGEVADQIEEFAQQAGGREALEQQAAQSGIAAEDLPRFVRDIVLDEALGDALTEDVDVPQADLQALYQQNIGQYDQVRARHILVAEEQQARDILAQVQADRSRFEELAAEFSTDTSNKDRGGDLGFAGRGQFVEPFENAIFGAEEGEVVLVSTQFGYHVVEVLERNTTTLAEARDDLRRQALQVQRQERVQELLREVAEDVGVTVNPRFGRWNPETGTVEPDPTPNGGVVTPAPEGEAPEVPVEAPVEQPAG